MKVNGLAFKVEIRNLQRRRQPTDGIPLHPDKGLKSPPDTYTIKLGETHDDMRVQQLFVGLEDQVVHIQLSDGTNVRYLTLLNAEVKVDWAQKPDVQSRTEWTLWVAEAIGHLKGLRPKGMAPEQRKFFTPKELEAQVAVEVAAAAAAVAQVKSVVDYKPIPLHPQGIPARPVPKLPPLHVVPTAGPIPDAAAEYAERQIKADAELAAAQVKTVVVPSISSTQTPVDNDAGGPDGFDVEEAVVVGAVAEEEPVHVEARMVASPPDGPRRLLVAKTDETVGLSGKQVESAGAVLLVESVELTELDGEEVVVLIIRQ